MAISVGDRLPDAGLQRFGEDGVETLSMAALLNGRKVVVFGLPGAFTRTCTAAHVPSFIRTKPGFDAKGVDEIVCVAVNDAFVMKAWGEATGATAAGLTMLGDPAAEFTKAIGMSFTNPKSGFYDRSKRYALYAEDGVVKVLNHGEESGVCEVSGGETMLGMI